MALKKDPAILLYKDKWINATQGMSGDCKGWYLDLIVFQFDHKDLPPDLDDLAAIARIKPSEFKRFEHVFEHVLKHMFKQNERGRLENETAKAILIARNNFKEIKSRAGKLSYILRYFREKFKPPKAFEKFLKERIDLNFDLKNEHMLEHVFKHNFELYINANAIVNKNSIKKSVIENPILNLEPELAEIKIHWIQEFISKNCPNVGKMKTQLAFVQAEQLAKTHKREVIVEVLEAMENKKTLLADYTSVYLTANAWCKRHFNKPDATNGHEYAGRKDFIKQPAK